VRGILYMVVAISLLSFMDAIAKWLIMGGLAVIQLVFLRSVLIVPTLLISYGSTGQLKQLKPASFKAHAVRGVLGSAAPIFFFLGIKSIPLTDAVVVAFSSIFFITILSIIFLHEKVGPHRWASIIIGFVGVLIVANPQGGGDLFGYILVFCGSTVYAMLFVAGRYLSATETVPSLVFSFNLCVGLVALLFMPWFWQTIPMADGIKVLVFAALALGGHFFITMAFAQSEASLIAPFEYTSVVWAIVFDIVLWQTYPTLSVILGACIVIGSGLYITYRESLRSTQAISGG